MLRQAFTRILKRYLAMVSRILDQERANHVPMGQHTTVAAAIRQAFPQPDADAAHQTLTPCRRPAKRRWPKLAALMDANEHAVPAYLAFPAQHRTNIHSTIPLERLNKEAKRRADAAGILSNEAIIVRVIGAVLLEQNDEPPLQHRYTCRSRG
jgi:transposase-like protein